LALGAGDRLASAARLVRLRGFLSTAVDLHGRWDWGQAQLTGQLRGGGELEGFRERVLGCDLFESEERAADGERRDQEAREQPEIEARSLGRESDRIGELEEEGELSVLEEPVVAR